METLKQVRLPHYAQTPPPAHSGHAEIIDFLLSGQDVPQWLRHDLHGKGNTRPARGAIGAVLALRDHFNKCHQPVSQDLFHEGLCELGGHFPLPANQHIKSRERIYWRYLQGVEKPVWQATVSLAHIRQKTFPVVRDLRSLIAAVVASRNWAERRLEQIEQSFQKPATAPNAGMAKALVRLRQMSPGDRLQLFNKARMRRPELANTDMREPAKWADLVAADLGVVSR
ncbi:hypothetical protein [uncultured Thalassospira sp.]|jgi:hypothetical protein|uniref:hypothetical protein n=1 Tax=uncultured Thalassospira sp. TaxID=404382 RepID=UPI0030DD695B|tara:strand:- start:4568 stop:5248 length:681 start_codon:yes stop_codon:yes gene_type:complete